MDQPGTVHDVGWYLLYAVSKDGIHWEKPALGLHRFGGRNDTNIAARDCPNAGVFKDTHDPDSARRYKIVFDVGLGQPRASFSADGIHWSSPQSMLGFTSRQCDTHNNACYDERSGKYLWFTKTYLGERLVSRLESSDFLHWTGSGVVLRSSPEEGRKTQTYALTVFPYAGIYLGYVMMYHVGAGRTVDCELAWSSDSVQWQRVKPGTPLLKLGTKGAYDGGAIFAQAGPPVVTDGRLQLYYGGSPTVHVGWNRSASLCLATLREDGFAGYAPVDDSMPSAVETSELRFEKTPPVYCADGVVSMTKIDDGNGTGRLRFALAKGARLYSITGATLINAALPPGN